MACQVYVGNFPMSFDEEDILNLFQDFEGIEMVRFIKRRNKCFSFLRCTDEEQVVDVVTTMHDIDVCGRNLIVRASDNSLQSSIEKSLLESGVLSLHPRNRCNYSNAYPTGWDSQSREPEQTFNQEMSTHVTSETGFVDTGYLQNTPVSTYEIQHTDPPNDFQTLTKQGHGDAGSLGFHSSNSNGSEYNGQQKSKYSNRSSIYRGADMYYQTPTVSSASGFDENPIQNINPQETFLKYAKKKNNPHGYQNVSDKFNAYASHRSNQPGSYSDASSVGSRNFQTTNSIGYREGNRLGSVSSEDSSPGATSSHSDAVLPEDMQISKYEVNFVSVVNFPLGLHIQDLYELFGDFEPIHILMVCNTARVDRTPTEAIVCFGCKRDATDAILNLDNTLYRGRVLLVTDAVDMTLVPELLSIRRKDQRYPRTKA